jgi:hypothetical protein
MGEVLNVGKRCCYDKSNYCTLVKIPFGERYIAAILKEVYEPSKSEGEIN